MEKEENGHHVVEHKFDVNTQNRKFRQAYQDGYKAGEMNRKAITSPYTDPHENLYWEQGRRDARSHKLMQIAVV